MKRPWLREEGSAAAELAILGPVLALLLGGMVEVGSLVQTSAVIRNAAREGARYAAVSDPSAAAKALAYLNVALAGRSDVTLPLASAITVNQSNGDNVGSAVTVVVPVTVRIDMPVISNLIGASVPLTATATMRISQ